MQRAQSRAFTMRDRPGPPGVTGVPDRIRGLADLACPGRFVVVADPAVTFVYADSGGNAFTFAAGATSFGTGSGSRGSLADLKIVPGHAVMLAAGAVSAEAVS